MLKYTIIDNYIELKFSGVVGEIGYAYLKWLLQYTVISNLARNKTILLDTPTLYVTIKGTRYEIISYLELLVSCNQKDGIRYPIFDAYLDYIDTVKTEIINKVKTA
jgi:hypothetical protein